MAEWQHPEENSPFAHCVDFVSKHFRAILIDAVFLITVAGFITGTIDFKYLSGLVILGSIIIILTILLAFIALVSMMWASMMGTEELDLTVILSKLPDGD